MDRLKKTDELNKTAFKGAATNKSMYKREWENIYPIAEANGNKYAFYSIPYKRNITCHHMALGDVKQLHITKLWKNQSKTLTKWIVFLLVQHPMKSITQ